MWNNWISVPELFQNGKKTIKSDIYNFIMLIYEIFKGVLQNKYRLLEIEKNHYFFYSLHYIIKEQYISKKYK